MPKLNRSEIEKLEDGESKNMLLSLFDEIVEKENEVESYRTKIPKDSEEIVSKTDHVAYKKAVADLAQLKQTFADNATSDNENSPLDFLSIFKV